jgi:hypothetical protein
MNTLIKVSGVPEVWNEMTAHVAIFCDISLPSSLYGPAINKMGMSTYFIHYKTVGNA